MITGRSAIFQGVATSGQVGPTFGRWGKTEVIIYALSADEISPALAAFQPRKHSPDFLPHQTPLPSPAATAFLRQRRQSV